MSVQPTHVDMKDERPAVRLDPDTCEHIFHAALKAGDTQGVEAALRVMAPQDPRRAQRLLDTLEVALAVRKAGGA